VLLAAAERGFSPHQHHVGKPAVCPANWPTVALAGTVRVAPRKHTSLLSRAAFTCSSRCRRSQAYLPCRLARWLGRKHATQNSSSSSSSSIALAVSSPPPPSLPSTHHYTQQRPQSVNGSSSTVVGVAAWLAASSEASSSFGRLSGFCQHLSLLASHVSRCVVGGGGR